MRIFFVTNNYIPYSGGVVQSITAIVNALRTQGHEVFIITLDFLGEKHDDPDYIIRIKCPLKFTYKKNYMAIPWRPTHTIKNLIELHKPDIIHVHHPFLLGVSALDAARSYNIACVFTYHTLYEEYAHYIPIPDICAKPLIRKTVQSFCNKVNAIIVPSTYVKNYLESQSITTPLSIITSPLRECFTNTLEKYKKENSSHFFELLLVTRFVPEKNIPFVFEVIQLLPNNFRLTIAGYGTDRKKLEEYAFGTLKLSPERIKFINKPTQEDLLQLYRDAHLFIFPSKTDTQGIVLAESMSQGLPVVALDGPGQRDIIINGMNGFITTNAQKTAEIILKISADKKLYNHLVSGAQATAHNYNGHIVIQKLLALYNSINNHSQ